tara:strand:- start:17185 stop:27846 length:10662 start_codon:yes stop_codon:yes gene_type:complete
MSDSKVKISNILESQLPEFILDDNPLFKDFLEQYYLSQEHEYGTIFLAENIDRLKDVDSYVNLKFTTTTPKLTKFVSNNDDLIEVTNHSGFLPKNGLVKIDQEIFTYTGKSSFSQKVTLVDPTANTIKLTSTVGLDSFRSQSIIFDTSFSNVIAGQTYYVTEVIDSNTITISDDPTTLDDVLDLDETNPLGATLPTATNFAFTGCVRGFSGIDDVSGEFLNFNNSRTAFHEAGTTLTNLGLVFLAEFFIKYKKMFLPGIEERQFQSVNIDNILSRARDFYSSKGTDTSLKILFTVLFGKFVEVLKPFDNTIQASAADFSQSDVVVVEAIEGNPRNLGETTLLQGSIDNPTAKAIISRVETILLGSTYYHKLFFPKNTIENKFIVSKKTKVLGVGVTNTTLTVDSTIGFPESGLFLNKNNEGLESVTYESKSANQFFNCVGLSTTLAENDSIIDGNFVYGYENNDINKLVTMRVVGTVIGVAENKKDTSQFRKNDVLRVKHLGEKVDEDDVRFNRWFYNNVVLTSVDSVSGTTFTTEVDHHLYKGDKVDILLKNDKSVLEENLDVSDVDNRKTFTVSGNISNTFVNTKDYLIRKKLDFGSDKLNADGVLANIQNSFIDADKNAYIAFSGLPGYDNIELTNRSKTFTESDIDQVNNKINIPNHNFRNGERVYYELTSGVTGIATGNYYVFIIDINNIKLAFSRASLNNQVFINFTGVSAGSEHKLTPASLFNRNLVNQNNFKRINRKPKAATEHKDIIGPIGVALNGVEFQSPISKDSIFYGQIDSINVLNSGTGYDIVNPPQIGIANTDGSAGAAFVGQFIGKIEDINLTAPGFNYVETPVVTISGGNGTEATAEARLRGFFYDKSFSDFDGVKLASDVISIPGHRFADTEEVIYSSTGTPIGIGSTSVGFGTDRLTSEAIYFLRKVSATDVKIHVSKSDAVAGINTVNINDFGTGTHNFRSRNQRKIVDRIVVTSSTDDFSSRKVVVDGIAWPPADQKDIYKSFVGVNIEQNYIYARNHSFKTGDNVEYSFDGTIIGGLSTSANYKVTVLDEDRFLLSEAGTPTAISSVNFDKKSYVNLTSVGVGTHTFQYPAITVKINGIVSAGNTDVVPSYYTAVGSPVILGKLDNVFVRNGGVGYGVSNVMNYKRDIEVKVETGKGADVKAIVVNGKIVSAYVADAGIEYTSPPTINVIGTGKLAKLTANITNGSITSINVIDGGSGYAENTRIEVIPTGINAQLSPEIHEWAFNDVERYKVALQLDNSSILKKDRLNREMVQINSGTPLKQTKLVSFYPGAHYRGILKDNLDGNGDEITTGFAHSPIVGWAYDGNPIYGPYGFANAVFDGANTGGTKVMLSSYELDLESSTSLRPPGFDDGFFIQDYVYKATGDLDEYNGRFCKTDEFPEGTYAYFSTIDNSETFSSIIGLAYPYITKSHYNQTDTFNYDSLRSQADSTINTGEYKRNVTHLGLNDPSREYVFLNDSMSSDVKVTIQDIKPSRVGSVDVLNSGSDYKVGEQINFNEESIDVEIAEVKGKDIVSIATSDTTLKNTIFSVRGNVVTGVTTIPHGFFDGDIVEITGIGSAIYKNLEGFTPVGVATVITNTTLAIGQTTATGITTTISLSASTFTNKFEVGNIIRVNDELMKIVGVDNVNNKYRVTRVVNDSTGSNHGTNSIVRLQPQVFRFIIDQELENKNIQIGHQQNFAKSAIGIGATYFSSVVGVAGSSNITVSIPDRAIFLPGHKFNTGDQLSIVSVGGTIRASAKSDLSNPFDISTTSLFALKISTDFIGIATSKAFVGINSTIYFVAASTGDNHTLQQVKDNLTGTVRKVFADVGVATAHGLQPGDEVTFGITPNKVQQFVLKFNTDLNKLVVDPKTFAPTGITTIASDIVSVKHGLNTGDLVVYTNAVGVATPLQSSREYYAIKIDEDTFRLAETRVDALEFPFKNIIITQQGHGTHEVAKINPKIEIINGGRFALNTSDVSLSGYDINFYKDNDFQCRYESTNIKRDGVIGDGVAGTQIIVDIDKDLLNNFYYRIEGDDVQYTNTYPTSVDETVDNYSTITKVESKFNQNYKITGIGDTTFTFTLVGSAETTSYTPAGFSTGFYSTSSATAIGGIHSVKVVNDGNNVKEFPAITSIGTTTGVNADLKITNTDIGEVTDALVTIPGIDFSEDTTIKPKTDSSLVMRLKNIRTLKGVGIVTAGNDYNVPPKVIAIGNDSIITKTTLEGGSVGEVEVISSDSNLREDLRVIATNNSNGVGVVNATSASGVNEISLKAPQTLAGFGDNFPFKVGDQIFVENIQITNASLADGYNSSDYGFRTFEVTAINTVAGTESVSYNITGLGFTGGDYNIAQNAQFGRVIKATDLATFKPEFDVIRFTEGEIIVDANDPNIFGIVAQDGWDEESGILRLNGVNGKFTADTVVRGTVGNFKATISEITEFDFDFNVGSTSRDAGVWKDDIGKMNDNLQRIHDNDYYQRFSYSIRGEIPLETWEETVDSLDHTAGYKNFSDFQIITFPPKKANVSIADTAQFNLLVDIENEASVHSRTSYDLASEDTESVGLSKIIKFDSKVITDYNESRTNKVLMIDDIGPQFNGVGNSAGQLVGLSTFTILTDGKSMLHHTVNPATGVGSSVITITDHEFNTGEELVYDPTNAGINTGSRLSIGSTSVPGIGLTTLLPDKVFAIRVTKDQFKVAISTADLALGRFVSFTNSVGIGSTQSFSTEGDLATTRSMITIDNIIQSPIAVKPVGVAITMSEAVGIGSTQITVSDSSKILGKSLLRFEDGEIIKVDLVNAGNVLNVQRGAMGTVAAAHTVGAASSVVTGDYRIKQGKIYFSDAPYGPAGVVGITTRSTFSGRIFYRLNYDKNIILDDISESFNGTADQFAMISSGVAVTGITTSHGAVLINNVFQKPFFGDVGSILKSDYRVVKTNTGEDLDFTGTGPIGDLPQGGIINEFTATSGTNYAVPARAIGVAVVNGSGVITGVTVGVGSTGVRSGGGGHLFAPNVSIADTLGGGTGAAVTATVGAGGTITGFTVVSGGTGYTQATPPQIFTDEPAPYKGLTLTGGTGSGAEMDVVVGTGGSIISFSMSKRGIGYKEGDVLELSGLPFDPVGIGSTNMLVTVDNKFQDKFSGWAFGQLLELDDFSIGFNGAKTNFLITRTETTKEFYSIVAKEGSGIILQNNFLIFMNDVLQKPGVDYEFNGGTRLKFKEAPRAGSNFKIYFYTGSEDDFLKVDIDETIKRGDRLRLQYQDPFASQEQRVIYELIASDTVETETYTGVGINTDTAFLRPVEWTKQTSDVIIDGRSISKARNSLEPQYYPSTNIIAPVGNTDTSISVENAWSFEKIDNLGQTQQDIRLVGATGIGLTIPTVETIQQVTYEGDYGLIEDITEFASGESGAIDSLDTLKFRVIPDPEIFIPSGLSAANKVTSTGISTGDYFVVRNTRIGSGVTSIDGDVSTVVANGADFIDNVYRASNVVAIAGTDAKLVSANVLSVVGVNTALPDNFNIKRYGNFSWGKIITGSRNGSSFVFQKDNPLSGVTTSAHVSRITELKAEY